MKTSDPLPSLSRRRFLGLAAAAAAGGPFLLAADAPGKFPSLGICLYGMGKLGLDETVDGCARIGYDNLELMTAPGYPAEPTALSPAARQALRRRLDGLGLGISSLLIEDTTLGVDGETHRRNLEAIKRGAQLAHDLGPEGPPFLDRILGGKPADWPGHERRLADRLADWAATAAAAGLKLNVKAHANQAVDSPRKMLWLMREVDNPALGVDFDYSHFETSGVSLTDSLGVLRSFVRFVQAKDVRLENGRIRYLLPGDGDIDYAAYFRLLRRIDYGGPVVVEISKMVFTRPGFDFFAAARKSFATLERARRAAG